MLAEQQSQSDAPFRSLAELRSAHATLMREARKDGSAANADRIADFIKRAQAAGAAIESQNDRDSAQGVLDYWVAWQFSSSRGSTASSTPPTLAEFVSSFAPQSKPAENPFVGLRAFEERDAGYFIGREEATRSLLNKLQLHHVVFVSGPLGSGKSSLVFAGVVPRLRSRSVLDTKKEPVFPVVIPGSDPLTALLRAILQIATVKPADENAWVADQRKKLQRAPKSLSDIVGGVAPGAAVIMIVDQFEEMFTLCSDTEARDQFTRAISALVEDPSSPNRAILIIREDYAQQTYAVAALKVFAKDTDAQFSPPQLTSAELVRVITSAADAVGLKFDQGIVEDLAQDAAGDPASLPTLQFTLSRLWAALPANSNRITHEIYRQVGKPRVALARAAEAAFERLTADEQAIAQRQFLELVQPTIGGDVRRRRIPLDNLAQLTGDSATQIAAVLKRFEQAELVRRTKGFDADDDRFEVAHEALVNNWKRLDDWLKVKRQESEKKLQLITAARLWRESGQSPGYLLTGEAIKDAMPYRDQAPEVRDLIAASEASAHRYSWIQGLIGTVLAVVIAVITTLYLVTWSNRTELRKDYDERDKTIQILEDRAAGADANAARLKETIAEQQKVIDQLRQQLRLPAPQPQLLAPNSTSTPSDLSSEGQEGWIWAGSDPDTNLRDAQNSAPVVPPSIAPRTRYVVGRNVVLRSDKPSDTYTQSPSLGLVLKGTPVTTLAPAIPYDRPSGTKQYWLKVRVDPSKQPIVYYQFANTARPDAQQLADTIQARGYRIAEIQPFDIAKGTNEVRYFFPADRPAAVKLAQDVAQILKDRRIVLPPTKVVDPTGSPLDRNYPGVLELWLDTSPR
jgi:uncharacterized coiled-coil protein SlyX